MHENSANNMQLKESAHTFLCSTWKLGATIGQVHSSTNTFNFASQATHHTDAPIGLWEGHDLVSCCASLYGWTSETFPGL